jgi:LemA protein
LPGHPAIYTVTPMAALIIFAVLLLIVVALLFWAIATYNKLVRQRNQVQAASSQIDVQLKRRHDLIPNLVETVKGYATHERGTLDAVVQARAAAVAANGAGPAQRAEAEGELSQVLSRLMVVAEAYPDLKANQNFLALQTELGSTEDKIAYARQFFNNAVQTINTTIQSVPSNIIAGMGGFKLEEYFEASGDERQAATVRF